MGQTIGSAQSTKVSTVHSRAPAGLAAPLVRVEVHLGPGLPAFFLVGLPEAVVRESRERVRSAVTTAGFEFPAGRLTVNLSPAELPKEGGRFDLPIAIGILAAAGHLSPRTLAGREFYGELALNGELRETPKLLPAMIAGCQAGAEVIVPAANEWEAGFVGRPRLKLAGHLVEVCRALNGGAPLRKAPWRPALPADSPADLAEVRGQYAAKRALEIAAAGGHGLLLVGPPGSGKTLLAQRLGGLMPPLGADEVLEVASLQSAAGLRPGLRSARPFRNPQHTASVASFIGAGLSQPGEMSLAHRGVLFLDEIPEFARNVLEALREPLESGVVVLSRAKRRVEFPASFQLVAAMNPCPCGYAGNPGGRCRCTGEQVARYRGRVSGPLLDRIDMHVNLAALKSTELIDEERAAGDHVPAAEPSAAVAARVAAARQRQLERQGGLNARLTASQVRSLCRLSRESQVVARAAIEKLDLSARGFHRILKMARTCADLAGAPSIRLQDVTEAVQLRVRNHATC